MDNEPIVIFKNCGGFLSDELAVVTNYNEKTDVLFVSNILKLIKKNCVFLEFLGHTDFVC